MQGRGEALLRLRAIGHSGGFTAGTGHLPQRNCRERRRGWGRRLPVVGGGGGLGTGGCVTHAELGTRDHWWS